MFSAETGKRASERQATEHTPPKILAVNTEKETEMASHYRKYGMSVMGFALLLCLSGCFPWYALNVITTGQGTVTLNPSGGTYKAGTTVTLTPVPAAGWHFDHWGGALSGNADPAQATMNAAKTVIAVFAINQYTLNVNVTGQGAVNLDPSGGTYDAGAAVTLMPVPAAGWQFDHWEGALSGNAYPAQITMDDDETVIAVFTSIQYTLEVNITGQGTVNLDPVGGIYDAGETVTVTPVPAAGWRFDHWEGALSGNADPAPITMNAAKTVTAVFTLNQYALNVSITGQGTVNLDPVGGVYDPGATVTLTPIPAAGWHFDRWEDALSGSASPAYVLMDADMTVRVVFEQDAYTLDVSVTGDGTITLDPPGGTYLSGAVVTLTPNPDMDNRFEIWGGDLSGTKQPVSLIMDENKYVEAYFMANTYVYFSPCWLCAIGATAYFAASGPHSGQELWKSDGTFEGTRLVKDIAQGYSGSGISFLTNLNETLYFFAESSDGFSLWKSDGTEEGTVRVVNLGNSQPALPPIKVNGKLYFSAAGREDGELWVTDGTAEGTEIVKLFGPSTGMLYSNPGNLADVGGTLYFNNSPQTDLFTLWKSDGTEAGTVPVYSSRWLSEIAGLNGQAFFYAGTDTSDSLFVTDGTPEGTHKMYDFSFGPGDFEVSGGQLYFAAETMSLYNTRVWATNGSNVYQVDTGPYRPWDLMDLDGTLLFEALYDVESVTHCGLFATTGSGASLLREINPTLFYGVDAEGVNINGTLYFAAENSSGGVGLWKSDGTAGGTVLVSDINAYGAAPSALTAVDGTLFFVAAYEMYGTQLWKSDGTLEGTLAISCPVP